MENVSLNAEMMHITTDTLESASEDRKGSSDAATAPSEEGLPSLPHNSCSQLVSLCAAIARSAPPQRLNPRPDRGQRTDGRTNGRTYVRGSDGN